MRKDSPFSPDLTIFRGEIRSEGESIRKFRLCTSLNFLPHYLIQMSDLVGNSNHLFYFLPNHSKGAVYSILGLVG